MGAFPLNVCATGMNSETKDEVECFFLFLPRIQVIHSLLCRLDISFFLHVTQSTSLISVCTWIGNALSESALDVPKKSFFYMNASNYIFKNLDGGRMIRKSSIIFERLHVTMAHISPSWSSSITKHFFAWWEIGAETRASFVTIDCMEPVTTNKCEGCLWMTSRIKFLVYRTSLH